MGKVRIYELAKDLGVSSKEIIDYLNELGMDITSHMSTVEDDIVGLLKDAFAVLEDTTIEEIEELEEEPKVKSPSKKKKKRIVEIDEALTVESFAEKVNVSVTEVIAKLMDLGMMLTKNADLEFDVAAIIADEFGVKLKQKQVNVKGEEASIEDLFRVDDSIERLPRAPVVTIMGHVDHGKTTLLDRIRNAEVAKSEAGGITQHIGAYQVEINDKKITFLDTPGHEAFTSMRARGAQVTDIAVLVVAANDGVMPQTIEAINHAKAAEVPIIIAINKMDASGANPDHVKQQLAEQGLIPEDWGGDTICVPVSALRGEGIEDLLDMILLVSEMQELKAPVECKAVGTIIEAKLDRSRGPVATVLIQQGTLKVSDSVVAGGVYGRIRAMVNDRGQNIKEAGPSMPVEVLGLNDVPQAGDLFQVATDDKEAREIATKRLAKEKEKMQKTTKVSLDDLFAQIKSAEIKELKLLIKADVQGSAEAVKQSLEKVSTSEVKVVAIHTGVGAINESDVMLASASNAIIIGFNVRPDPIAKKQAERESVDIRLYRVIYDAVDDIEKALKGMLDPKYKEEVIGHAEVREVFKVPKIGNVGGCYVTDGKIHRSAKARVLRDNIVIYEGDLGSLKRFKDDVREVAAGFECGIGFEKFNDIKEGDIIEAYQMIQVE
ncbi:MAG TPA: translation initiation factor IF-2 [Firmicutes bacterium]|nr:translation initiation factor IF-2 [Bacillota bacterium]